MATHPLPQLGYLILVHPIMLPLMLQISLVSLIMMGLLIMVPVWVLHMFVHFFFLPHPPNPFTYLMLCLLHPWPNILFLSQNLISKIIHLLNFLMILFLLRIWTQVKYFFEAWGRTMCMSGLPNPSVNLRQWLVCWSLWICGIIILIIPIIKLFNKSFIPLIFMCIPICLSLFVIHVNAIRAINSHFIFLLFILRVH